MALRIIRAADCRPMRWKNGGGETIELAAFPGGATLADFDWRVSMARVETDGPFSTFPGVDRTLTILEGDGLILTIDGDEVELTSAVAPLSFNGAATTSARLRGGAVLDLNLMTRSARYAHKATRLYLTEIATVTVSADDSFIIPVESRLMVETEEGVIRLEPRDALHGHSVRSAWRLAPERPSHVYVLEIFDLAVVRRTP